MGVSESWHKSSCWLVSISGPVRARIQRATNDYRIIRSLTTTLVFRKSYQRGDSEVRVAGGSNGNDTTAAPGFTWIHGGDFTTDIDDVRGFPNPATSAQGTRGRFLDR